MKNNLKLWRIIWKIIKESKNEDETWELDWSYKISRGGGALAVWASRASFEVRRSPEPTARGPTPSSKPPANLRKNPNWVEKFATFCQLLEMEVERERDLGIKGLLVRTEEDYWEDKYDGEEGAEEEDGGELPPRQQSIGFVNFHPIPI